ncbi:MAG: DUF6174 domain-containing protein [Bacteroidota bacterium]|nr:DUF6174 domain-containing protein [Bacteroidota bacterium]
MKYYIYLLLFTLISFGCKDEVAQFDSNDPYQKWHRNKQSNYTIDQSRVCECIDGGQTMRVIVRNDTVFQVIRLSDNTALSYKESKRYLTIDSLFGIIRYSKRDSLVINYNQQFGYPEKLDINPQMHPVDGGVLYNTTNLQFP